MDRREALQRTALAFGFTISSSAAGLLLKSCSTAQPEEPIAPRVLSEAEAKLVNELSECILPQTNTPGAKALKVVEFIDLMLYEVIEEEKKTAFIKALNTFALAAESTIGQPFIKSDFKEQTDFLQSWVDDNFKENKSGLEWEFFRLLKEMTLLGYYTSEKVGKNIMAYDPVPGQYNGCIDIEEDQMDWSG